MHAADSLAGQVASLPPATPILDINFGFARACVLDAAVELQVFPHMAAGHRSAAALARASGCSELGMARLLHALAGLGLIEPAGDGYALGAHAAAYLAQPGPGYLGDHLAAVLAQWDSWRELAQVVRTGQPARDLSAPGSRQRLAPFFAHVLPLVFPVACQLAEQVALPPGARVLSLGASDAAWAIALAARHAPISIVVQDEPGVLDVARAVVEERGLGEHVRYRQASPDQTDGIEGRFDLVIISHLCRYLGAERSRRLLGACAQRLLAPQGALVIADIIPGEQGGPPSAPMIGLSMLVNTQDGDVYPESIYRSWLASAGLGQVRRLNTPAALLYATR